jgi:hypothetical protein
MGTGTCVCCIVRSPSKKKEQFVSYDRPPTFPPYWLRWKGALNPEAWVTRRRRLNYPGTARTLRRGCCSFPILSSR